MSSLKEATKSHTHSLGAETASDIPILLTTHPGTAMDLTLDQSLHVKPPPGYPCSTVVLCRHEALAPPVISFEFGRGITLHGRFTISMKECDAISIRTCQEIEGQFCDYIGSQYGKPVLLTGPVLHEVMKMERPLEDRWARWLEGFEPNSVLFCAFGSQLILEKDQFQELLF
ncbi:hypothetical protein ACSBR2_018958 [Camellia fascicularis]